MALRNRDLDGSSFSSDVHGSSFGPMLEQLEPRLLLSGMPGFQWFEVDGERTTSTGGAFEVEAGEEFWVRADFENRYDDRAGGITMSFPDFDGTYLSGNWGSYEGDSQGYRNGFYYLPGYSPIYTKLGNPMTVEALMIEGFDGHWESGDLLHLYDEDNILAAKLRAPSSGGSFYVYVRGWLIDDLVYDSSDYDNANWSLYDTSPASSNYLDQQYFPSFRYTVNVVMPNRSPNMPTSEDPSDGDSSISISTDLDWSCSDPDGDTLYYTVYIDKNDSAPQTAVKTDALGSSAALPTLDYGSHYFWQVKADDHNGGVTWSPVWDFYTEPEPEIISAYWWDPTTVTEGTEVTMCAQVSGYSVGETFAFDVYEDDAFDDDYVDTFYGDVYYSAADSGYFVKATWTSEWQDDGVGVPEFIFTVSRGGASRTSGNQLVVSRARELQVPFYYQPTSKWCWAASAAMLLEYYGGDWKPESVAADDHFNAGPNEGMSSWPGLWDFDTWDLESFLESNDGGISDAWDWSTANSGDGLKQYTINAIRDGHPVWVGSRAEGHALVITGFNGEASDRTVYYNDPEWGPSSSSWPEFLDWAGAGVMTPVEMIRARTGKLEVPAYTAPASIQLNDQVLFAGNPEGGALYLRFDGQEPWPGLYFSSAVPGLRPSSPYGEAATQADFLELLPSVASTCTSGDTLSLRLRYSITALTSGLLSWSHTSETFVLEPWETVDAFDTAWQFLKVTMPVSALTEGVYLLGITLEGKRNSGESFTLYDSTETRFEVVAADYQAAEPVHAGFGPSTLHSGEQVSIFLDIENTESTAGGEFTTRFYVSENTVITGLDYLLGEAVSSGIGANGVEQVGITSLLPEDIPHGDYYVGWIIEANDNDQGNNSGYISGQMLTVLEADIDVELPGQVDDVHTYPFGDVGIGDSVLQEFRVGNEGNETIVVSNLTGLNPPFDVSMPNTTIQPDEIQILTITYAPQGEGFHSDTLIIQSNDPDESSYEITLTGAGVAVVQGDQFEDDDSPSRATAIETDGTPQHHTIHAGSDEDWVSFTVSERSRATIETSGLLGDTQLWLYGPNDWTNELDYDNDGGNATFSRIVRDDADALEAGTYYVKIGEDGGDHTIDGYTVSVVASSTKVVYVVTSSGDTIDVDGDVTLREAIQAASTNATVGDAQAGSDFDVDIITFDSSLAGGTIVLNGTELRISDDLAIRGLGSNELIIDANDQSRVFYIDDEATVLMDGVAIEGGYSDSSGGGIHNAGDLRLTNTTVSGNLADGEEFQQGGGGIFNSGILTLTNTMVFGNSAPHRWAVGGGILNEFNGSLALANTVVSGNSADEGGGIWNYGALTATNATIAGNSAVDSGGGICNWGDLTLQNTIMVFNDVSGYVDDIHGSYTGEGNLIGVDPSFVRNPSDGGDGWRDDPDTPGIDESANDDYGDLRLIETSVAVDLLGDVSLLPPDASDLDGDDDASEAVPFDLDRNSRVIGGIVDVGAYEYQGEVLSGRDAMLLEVSSVDDVVDIYDGVVTLREAILYAGLDHMGSEITFASGLFASGMASITLDGMPLTIGEDMQIVGPGADRLTVNGDERSRVFSIFNGQVGIEGVRMTGGVSSDGGAIFNDGGSALTLVNVTVSSNSAVDEGGGIYNEYESSLVLTNTTVSSNLAEEGGGIYSDGFLTLTNSTISHNSSTGWAGGICNWMGSVTLNNTVVALNDVAGSPDDVLGAYTPENSFVGTVDGDPLLTIIADNGGAILYCVPQPGSPLINSGSDILALRIDGSPLVTDQIGNPRVYSRSVDVGSIEYVLPGDADLNSAVDDNDCEVFTGEFGLSGEGLAADFNRDGRVDLADFVIMRSNFGNSLEVPFDLVVSDATMTVPEGGTAQFTVALSAQPLGTVTVTTSRTSGDEHLSVASGGMLTFDSTNWSNPQAVIIAAGEDADTADGTAEFTITAADVTNTLLVTATEQDNDGDALPVEIEVVPVGNVGNAADSTGYGAVADAYSIGKYEVTSGQYTKFLNAVAAADTYGLYNTNMDIANHPWACNIIRTGNSGSYSYTVAAEWANRPVNGVGWGDAARFANWLHNGQPKGAQGESTTEDGAYYLNGAITQADLLAVSREADWEWAIPTENEWYKAAYHKNDGNSDNYFDYPTGSDSLPGREMDDVSGNNANYSSGPIDSPHYTTLAGEFQNSASPYGTFDQGGNVGEWNEAIIETTSTRGVRGGTIDAPASYLLASHRASSYPTNEENNRGFRVVRNDRIVLNPEILGSVTLDQTPRWHSIGSSPAGDTLFVPTYVAGDTSSGIVYALDSTTLEIVGTMATGYDPIGVAISPDGAVGYATNTVDGYKATKFDAVNMTVIGDVSTGTDSAGLVFTPGGTTVYTTNHWSSHLSIIDVATNTNVGSVPGINPGGLDLAITPDGQFIYVLGRTGDIYKVSTTSNTVVSTITRDFAGSGGQRIAMLQDGGQFLVSGGATNSVHAFDTTTDSEADAADVGGRTGGLAVSGDGRLVAVTLPDADQVKVLDTANLEELAALDIADNPIGVEFSPGYQKLYVTTRDDSRLTVVSLRQETPEFSLVSHERSIDAYADSASSSVLAPAAGPFDESCGAADTWVDPELDEWNSSNASSWQDSTITPRVLSASMGATADAMGVAAYSAASSSYSVVFDVFEAVRVRLSATLLGMNYAAHASVSQAGVHLFGLEGDHSNDLRTLYYDLGPGRYTFSVGVSISYLDMFADASAWLEIIL